MAGKFTNFSEEADRELDMYRGFRDALPALMKIPANADPLLPAEDQRTCTALFLLSSPRCECNSDKFCRASFMKHRQADQSERNRGGPREDGEGG